MDVCDQPDTCRVLYQGNLLRLSSTRGAQGARLLCKTETHLRPLALQRLPWEENSGVWMIR